MAKNLSFVFRTLIVSISEDNIDLLITLFPKIFHSKENIFLNKFKEFCNKLVLSQEQN